MLTLKIILFVGILLVFYAYLGYGLLVWILLKFKLRSPKNHAAAEDPASENVYQPPVTLVIAAFNEAAFIRQKIRNSLQLDYPAGSLKFIFVTDGSNDQTPEIVREYPAIRLLHSTERRGKVAAIHRAMAEVDTPVVIFSDANTLLNPQAVREIARHYADPKIGGVAGEKKVISVGESGVAGAGEGLYWKYESVLKKLDSDFHSVVGAAGELFSVRTELYANPGDHVLLDDFLISLRICERGYRVVYEPDAFATETPSDTLGEEEKRKIRISAGAFQSMWMLRGLLNPAKHGWLSFQYISHRVLRWTLSPLFLPLILLSNILLVALGEDLLYQVLLGGQIVFYLLALGGYLQHRRGVKSRLLYVPYYFVFINICLYLGFFRFLKGSQSVLWDKAARKQYPLNNVT